MNKPLVIVESPTKERTLRKYIGRDFNVASTVGHIKDLPEKELGIDVHRNFEPRYVTARGKQKVINALKTAANRSGDIYLAPDPDREGEAIAFHTAEVLRKKGRRFRRVLFHELTRKGIMEALSSPEDLNLNKYKAQQTRRILDRLVGYQISPILWQKVKYGLSAGRVQSVAVRMICERERAIQAFIPEEYWSVTAHLQGGDSPPFMAKLTQKNDQKLKIENQQAADQILDDLKGASFVVDKVVRKTVKRNPYPPFTTSKLQQEAINKLHFSAKKTMTVAQQLYEGVDLGKGEYVGLITYMRTDSTRISAEAAREALDLIRERFGTDYAPDQPRFFKNKNKVQDAHEAIRPASTALTPETVAPHLSKDQLALYRIIWDRFVASQMAQALINQVAVSIKAGDYLFTAGGSTIAFPGFMALYTAVDDEKKEGEGGRNMLPELTEKMVLDLKKLEPKQHFTTPPPRFSEASLVKELEENGIGRPSTYAAILTTIQDKGYVEKAKGHFKPSELGFIVSDLLVENFPDILNVDFTARMEDDLDRVEAAEAEAIEVLHRFYERFENHLEAAGDHMLSLKGTGMPTDLNCPACGSKLHIKVGKNGPFLSCTGYPQCTYSRNYTRDEKGAIRPVEPVREAAEGEICDKCGRPMLVRQGRYGDFLACSGYPECQNTRSINNGKNGHVKPTGVRCPQPGCTGEILERISRRGKTFYGCSRFPECNYATWDKPVLKSCPLCRSPFLVEKETKKEGKVVKCMSTDCGYKESGGDSDRAAK